MAKLTDDEIQAIVDASGVVNDNDDSIDDSDAPDADVDMMKTWKHHGLRYGLRIFMKRNSEMLYIVLALFIFTEGIALFKFTSFWWVPLIAFIGIMALMIAWKSTKSVIKSVISIIVLGLCLAFQMMFASSFSNSAITGLLLPSITLCAFFIFICISYMIDTNVSRWTAAMMGTVAAFMISYGFLFFGLIPSSIASAASMLLFGLLWMFGRNAFQRRSSKMPARPTSLDSTHSMKIHEALSDDFDVIDYDKCKYPFYVLLPKDSDTGKIVILQPLDFTTRIVESARRGLIYHNRRIGEYLYRVASYARSRIDENAIVLICDWSGQLKTYDILGIEMSDSNNRYNIGLINMSRSRKNVRNDIIGMVNRFVYPAAKKRTVNRLRGLNVERKHTNAG